MAKKFSLKSFPIGFFVIFLLIAQCQTRQMSCDELESDFDGDKHCLMTKSSNNDSDSKVSNEKDEKVLYIDFSRNKNVEFLPVSIFENFPNLFSYRAERCEIKKVEYRNFAKLFHLHSLNLNGNKIKAISLDTFIDLVSVELILLGECLFVIALTKISFKKFVKSWERD